MTEPTPYIADILAQPAALRDVLEHYPYEHIAQVRNRLVKGKFRRIVLTGMGSSYYGAYPAWLQLAEFPIPTVLINAAELVHYGLGLIDAHTLLWMNSQSGRSAEIVLMLEKIAARRPGYVLSMTNDLGSPLGAQADLPVAIYAGQEATVSTKTYLNMLAVLTLASNQITGGDWQALRESMHRAADAMQSYLAGWQEQASALDGLLGEFDQLFILGRGPSMSAVWNGGLIVKEAAKCAFEGMNAADFRHGPLELAAPGLAVLVFEGGPGTRRQNRDLACEIVERGGKAIWVSMQADPFLPTLRLPALDESARPLVEILPLQMLTIVMARRNGLEPGKFRNIGKVTLQE